MVGYQSITLTQGYHFFTVTFDDISDATQFKLSEIGCFQADGTTWNDSKTTSKQCKGDIYLQKIDTKGFYGDGVVGGEKVTYGYYGNTDKVEEKMGWFKGLRADDFSNKIIGDNEVYIKSGDGFIVYVGKTSALFQVAGSVHLTDREINIAAQGYYFGGNSTPVPIKLSQVGCFQADGTTWNDSKTTSKQCKGDIYLQKIDTKGFYGDGVVGGEKVTYGYYGNTDKAEEKMGWFKGLRADDFSNKIIGDNDIIFEPGEGWILYCGKAAAKIVLPKPIAD